MSNTPKLPYVLNDGYYQYNLQWLVNELLSFKSQLDSAIDLKTIHYADPLHWDITTQYAPNTVVVDPKVGTAYMSKQPVPAGILLTNTDYWVVVFNYQKIYEDIKSGIAPNEGDSLNASRDYLPTELLWYGNSLYRAVRKIPEGSIFIPGTNITPATIAGMLEAYYGRDRIAQVLTDTLNVSGTYKLSAVNAILEMDGDLSITAGDITVNADNKTETFTGDVTVTADNKTETFKGNIEQSGVNKTETFTGDVTQTANSFTWNESGKQYQIKDFLSKSRGTFGCTELRCEEFTADSTGSLQVIQCIGYDGTYVYLVYSTVQGDTRKSIVKKMSKDLTREVLTKTLTMVSHANDVTYHKGNLYLIDDTKLYKLNNGLDVIDTYFVPNSWGICSDGSTLYIGTTAASNYGFAICALDDSFTPTKRFDISLFNPTGIDQLCLEYYKSRFYMPASAPSYTAVLNLDGELEYLYNNPLHTEHHAVMESDGICWVGDTFYMGFNTALTTPRKSNQVNIVSTNFSVGNSSRTNRIFNQYFPDASVGVYVDGDSTNTFIDGSMEYPYHSIYDALQGFKDYVGVFTVYVKPGTYGKITARNKHFSIERWGESGTVLIQGMHLTASTAFIYANIDFSELDTRTGVSVFVEFGSVLYCIPKLSGRIECASGSHVVSLSGSADVLPSAGITNLPSNNYYSSVKTQPHGSVLYKADLYNGEFSATATFNGDSKYYCVDAVQLTCAEGTAVSIWNNQNVTFTFVTADTLYLVTYKITEGTSPSHTMTRVGKKLTLSTGTWESWIPTNEALRIYGVI